MSRLLLSFPKGLAVALLRADHPLDATNLAATFCQGGKTYVLRQVA